MSRFRRYFLVALFGVVLLQVLWKVIAPLMSIALIGAGLFYVGRAIYERRRW
jgi:hypothetical protein